MMPWEIPNGELRRYSKMAIWMGTGWSAMGNWRSYSQTLPQQKQAAAARCIVAFRFVLSGFALACVRTAVGGRNSPWLDVTVHVACHSQWTDGLTPFISLQPPRESKLHCSQCAMMECSAYSVPAGHLPVQRIDVHQTSIFQDSCGHISFHGFVEYIDRLQYLLPCQWNCLCWVWVYLHAE